MICPCLECPWQVAPWLWEVVGWVHQRQRQPQVLQREWLWQEEPWRRLLPLLRPEGQEEVWERSVRQRLRVSGRLWRAVGSRREQLQEASERKEGHLVLAELLWTGERLQQGQRQQVAGQEELRRRGLGDVVPEQQRRWQQESSKQIQHVLRQAELLVPAMAVAERQG